MSDISEKRARKSREEWVELMAAYDAGELTQREFCERHGVAYSTFGYWRKQLRSSVAPLAGTSEPLLELSPLALGDGGQWRVEVDLGCGVKLRVR